jgi:serine/threonine protein kinase
VTKGTLGEGAFGKVRRCRVKKTGDVFALKQMCKIDIVQMGQVEHIMQETSILSNISHPFVTNKCASRAYLREHTSESIPPRAYLREHTSEIASRSRPA